MSILTGNDRYKRIGQWGLQSVAGKMRQSPFGYSQWLCVLDFYLSTPEEIILVGSSDNPQTRELLYKIHSMWLPNKIVAAYVPEGSDSLAGLPVFKGRQIVNGQSTVYVCKNYSCRAPITDVNQLEKELVS
jgi:uncharacterized protein YyaL (SSP411 family)